MDRLIRGKGGGNILHDNAHGHRQAAVPGHLAVEQCLDELMFRALRIFDRQHFDRELAITHCRIAHGRIGLGFVRFDGDNAGVAIQCPH